MGWTLHQLSAFSCHPATGKGSRRTQSAGTLGSWHLIQSSFAKLPRRPEQIEAYLATLQCGDERRAGYFRALRAFYRFLVRRRLITINPFDMMDSPRRTPTLPRYLTADELDQLLRYPHTSRMKACLLFLADTGCRVGELLSLSSADIFQTPDGWVARIDGKTGPRLVPIESETASAILKEVPIPWSRWWLSRQLARAFDAAHVPGNGSRLRHTFGTLWDGEDMDLQQIMGHANLSTTRIYRHLRTERLCQQHHLHSPLRQILTASRRML